MFVFTKREIAIYYATRVPALRQRGKEWRGSCPVHRGTRDSFAVDPSTGRAYCHSECNRKSGWGIIDLEAELCHVDAKTAAKQVLQMLDRTDTVRGRNDRRIVETYPYTDEGGKVLFEVVRYHPKGFNQRRPDGNGGWIYNKQGVRTLLYQLPKVMLAQQIFVVEGEKDVHTLEKWGFTATTNPQGAEKWRPEHSRFLSGKEVVILPDNDEEGLKHAKQVFDSLTGLVTSVCILELPDLPPKGDISDWVHAGHTREEFTNLVAAVALNSRAQPTSSTRQLLSPPEPPKFRVDEGGVYLLKVDEKDRWICPKLEVDAQTRDFNGTGWGFRVRFHDRENRERSCLLRASQLAGEGKDALEQLVDMGFRPRRDRKSIEAVKDFIYYANPDKTIRCVDRIGWHKGAFVLPDTTFAPNDSEEVVFYSESAIEHKYRQAGTLEEWKNKIGRLCSGNSRLIFAVCCAFAAPLLDLVKAESGGFHFRGLSSTGKTTALLVAGSVWGGGSQTGFLETWRATANGIEARAALHNHALLPLDEIGEVRDNEIGSIVYALGNGGGKSRMNRNLTSRANHEFKLLLLSTGERSPADLIRESGRTAKGGQEVRLVDVPADAGRGFGIFEVLHEYSSADQFARALSGAAKTIYGVPIDRFLRGVVQAYETIADDLRHCRDQFVKRHVPIGSSGEVFRVAAIFGLVKAAGEWATGMGITGWTNAEVISAVDRCFLAWLSARGGTGARDIESGILAVRAFIQIEGAGRFQNLHDNLCRVQHRAGFKECVGGQWHYYILPEVFQNEICNGFDYQAVAKELIRRGHLKTQKGNHLTIRKRVEELGTPHVFGIEPSFLEDEATSVREPFGVVAEVGTGGTMGTETVR